MSCRVAAIPSSLTSRAGEPDLQGEADRHAGYQQAMLERSFMIAANVLEPGVKPVFLDAVDDLRGGAIGIRKIDRLAVPNGREHGRKGRRAAADLGRAMATPVCVVFSATSICASLNVISLGRETTDVAPSA